MVSERAPSAAQGVSDLAVLRASLPSLPYPSARTCFVLMCGLPGTGKSYFSRWLAREAPLAILDSDVLRRALFFSPTHSPPESRRLFQAIHQLLAELLRQRVSVVLDATNLVERNRKVLYRIADETDAHLIIVQTEASLDVVWERLDRRMSGTGDPEDNSDAGWPVYQRMRHTQQPVRRQHLRVDTSEHIGPAIRAVVQEIERWNSTLPPTEACSATAVASA